MESKYIIVIDESDKDIFVKKVQEALEKGFRVSSSSCGYVPAPYDCEYFIAILVSEVKI